MPIGLPGAPKMTLMGVTVEELGPADVAALGSRVAANIAGAVKVPEGVLREVLEYVVALVGALRGRSRGSGCSRRPDSSRGHTRGLEESAGAARSVS
jgi:hypothetical protein